MSGDGAVRVLVHEGRARVDVGGILDLDTREAFLRALDSLPAACTVVEIDLRDVEFLDSTGLSAVLQADRDLTERLGIRPRVLVSESGAVRRMLQLTLLHLSLDIRVA